MPAGEGPERLEHELLEGGDDLIVQLKTGPRLLEPDHGGGSLEGAVRSAASEDAYPLLDRGEQP